VNDNITSMVEQAVAGLSTISTWTTNAHTLTTADGTSSESRCAMLVLATGAGGTALSAAGELICPAASKMYVVKNGAAYAVTLKTSAGSGVAVPAGETAFLFCDGTNVNACVTTIVNGHISGNLTVDGNTTLGDATSDTITATGQFNTDLLPSTDNARDLGSTAKSWRTLYCETSVLAGNLSLAGNTLSSTNTNGDINVTPNGTGAVVLPLLRLSGSSSGYVGLKGAAAAGSTTYTLPAADGTSGQVLSTNGSATLSWATAGGGGTPGGSTTQVQFNDAGVFGGDSDFTWDKTDNVLNVHGIRISRGTGGNQYNLVINQDGNSFGATNTSAYTIAIGNQLVLDALTTGSFNIAIGTQALSSITTGGDNTAIGQQAGQNYGTSSQQNTLLGRSAGSNQTSGNNNIIIGYNAAGSTTTVSNEITLGNASVTNFRVPGVGLIVADNPNTLSTAGYTNNGESTVADLVAAATAGSGARAFVTDATSTTFASTVAGGGSNKVPVYSDGTNWKIG
jgi:hypothetical protein